MISVVLGFHLCVSRRSLQLTLALVGWCWLGWFLLVSVGELIFDLFLTSSNNLTATVESNAATEKKKHTDVVKLHDDLLLWQAENECTKLPHRGQDAALSRRIERYLTESKLHSKEKLERAFALESLRRGSLSMSAEKLVKKSVSGL